MTLLFLSYPTSNLLGNPFASTFTIHSESDYIPPLPLPSLWSKPPCSPTWMIAIAFWLVSLFQYCSQSDSVKIEMSFPCLKLFNGFPPHSDSKPMSLKCLISLCPHSYPITSLTSSPATVPLPHSTAATLASLLFSKHITSCLRAFYLFPLPSMLIFFQFSPLFALFLWSLLKCHFPSEDPWSLELKLQSLPTPPPHSLSLSLAYHHLMYYMFHIINFSYYPFLFPLECKFKNFLSVLLTTIFLALKLVSCT